MRQALMTFLNDQSGATAIEYGVLATLVAIAAVPAAGMLGAGVSEALAEISSHLGPNGPGVAVQGDRP